MPNKIIATGGKISGLNMEAEDSLMSILKYNINGRDIPISLDLSFAQTKETRFIYIQFFDSTLKVDWMSNSFILYDINGNVKIETSFPLQFTLEGKGM